VTTSVNAAITRMLGYSEEELVGKSMFTFSDPERKKVALEKFFERTYGKSERYKLQLRKKDGSGIWCLVSANPIVENHQFIGTVTVITDFTEYLKADIAKDKRIEELEKQLADRV
jgi:PAS domain S-box-containing protein